MREGYWKWIRPFPGMEAFEAVLRERHGDAEAERFLDMGPGAGLNLSIFPNLLVIGNHLQVIEPLTVDSTALSWYGTTHEAIDNRAAMIRVQGRVGDPGSHIENRSGEPTANPYLYMASQLIAGLEGIESKLDPGPLRPEPYAAANVARLPTSLREAIEAMSADMLYRAAMGDQFIETTWSR